MADDTIYFDSQKERVAIMGLSFLVVCTLIYLIAVLIKWSFFNPFIGDAWAATRVIVPIILAIVLRIGTSPRHSVVRNRPEPDTEPPERRVQNAKTKSHNLLKL
jgi:hypothetical protein